MTLSITKAALITLVITTGSVANADETINATIETDSTLYAMLPERVRDAGQINAVTYAGSAPCDFMEEDGVTFTGWEEDYRQAIGAKLGIAIEPVSIAFSGLIPGVESGRYDFAMQCISETAERVERVNFVTVAISGDGIYRLSDNPDLTDDPLSLCGSTSGAMAGTTYGATVDNIITPNCVSNGLEPITVNEYSSHDAVLLALLSKRIDFIVNDASQKPYIEATAGVELSLTIPEIMPHNYNGMVLRKDDTELAEALAAAAVAILEDGTTEAIMEKWNLSHLVLFEPGINAGTAARADAAQ
jgi:polar amino acid transport system substrate-binding protein